MTPQILPRALRPGSVVSLVCPSGHATDEKINVVQSAVEEMGYKALIHPQCYRKDGYFAGTDDERADALHEAFSDPRVDAIFAVRGGYGAMRLLDKLDYNLIASNPKIFMGMSDITALQWAITSQTGLITFSGPTHKMWNGPNNKQCQVWVKDLLEGHTRTIPSAMSKTELQGTAEGELWGGTFALIRSMVGTVFMPQNRKLILFGEDVDEHTLRLDSLFQHLKYGGILKNIAGVALGEFLKCDDTCDHGKTIPQLLREAMPDFKGPLATNLPFGHCDNYCVLPMGAKARLTANGDQVKLELLQQVVENPLG
jgi:muramoyltetrapeptide carboxypeptidase